MFLQIFRAQIFLFEGWSYIFSPDFRYVNSLATVVFLMKKNIYFLLLGNKIIRSFAQKNNFSKTAVSNQSLQSWLLNTFPGIIWQGQQNKVHVEMCQLTSNTMTMVQRIVLNTVFFVGSTQGVLYYRPRNGSRTVRHGTVHRKK